MVGACAGALGVSADWLLSLSDRPESAAELLASSLSLTEAPRALVDERIFDWHQEAEGYKIRHVPAALPDMIPGAFSCPRGMLEFWIDPDSPYHKPVFNQDKTYVFYCASAWRSALSAKAAMEMGLKPVVHLEGGFSEWAKQGGPVVPREG